jgi:PEP-CTERM motif-containing protein
MRHERSNFSQCGLAAMAVLLALGATAWADAAPAPKITGNWWQICDSNVDLGAWTSDTQDACDFTVFQADDGTWQLIACMRYTDYPGSTRLFHRWQADSLTDTMWEPQGVFLTTDMSIHTVEGRLQAPHSFVEDGTHYLFYNNAGAFCMTSPDGLNWTHHTDYQGNHKFFDMGRDVMIYDDRAGTTGKWIAYYTTSAVDARTADSLEGPWSAEFRAASAGNPESPFVMKQGDYYFRWSQNEVYRSQDPTDFAEDYVTKMWWWKYAPEIIVDDSGQLYAAAYSHGRIYVAPMEWTTDDDPAIDVDLTSITPSVGQLVESFDPNVTSYTLEVPIGTGQDVTVTAVKSNPGANLSTNYFPLDKPEIRLDVTGTNGHANERYILNVVEVPEPATMSVLALSALGIAAIRRRR